ncbi:MAG: hypothetical protein JRM72_08060 [Nitrososphaerota archaeon]|jgi:predicted transcriptional regulator|nr:hypothetical protein [Nitrososphaerota archaeon]MDG7037320.1 hypothetical protein [Nitrososphaerota archaeon]MDG7040446.1 hypothetical protein [Nitrososphaerota archaeon]
MSRNLVPEMVLLILIQKHGLLFRQYDFIKLGYSKWQYYRAIKKLLAAGLIKRLGKGQYVVEPDLLAALR